MRWKYETPDHGMSFGRRRELFQQARTEFQVKALEWKIANPGKALDDSELRESMVAANPDYAVLAARNNFGKTFEKLCSLEWTERDHVFLTRALEVWEMVEKGEATEDEANTLFVLYTGGKLDVTSMTAKDAMDIAKTENMHALATLVAEGRS
jgi:hypothetical protein